MFTDRTLAGLLPWWLFGYVAVVLLLAALAGRWRMARSLALVLFGAPAVALGTVAAQQFLPRLVCEILFFQYLIVVLTQASRVLFGAAAMQRTITAMLVHGVLRPVFDLAVLCLWVGWRWQPGATVGQIAENDGEPND